MAVKGLGSKGSAPNSGRECLAVGVARRPGLAPRRRGSSVMLGGEGLTVPEAEERGLLGQKRVSDCSRTPYFRTLLTSYPLDLFFEELSKYSIITWHFKYVHVISATITEYMYNVPMIHAQNLNLFLLFYFVRPTYWMLHW